MTGYSVKVYDCAGLYRETDCEKFETARVLYAGARRKYPDKYVAVINYDRCDYNSDGLSDEERDELEAEPERVRRDNGED